jgi:hypothetical protein
MRLPLRNMLAKRLGQKLLELSSTDKELNRLSKNNARGCGHYFFRAYY